MKRPKRLSFYVFVVLGVVGWVWFTHSLGNAAAQNKTAEQESKSGYSFFVNGLKQFPLPHKISNGYTLATFAGFGSCDGKASDPTCQKFELVTIEDKLIEVEVHGNEISLALLGNELSPITGKYAFWEPVILFPLQPANARTGYGYYELDVVGRFWIEFDRSGSDPNRVISYKNEWYH